VAISLLPPWQESRISLGSYPAIGLASARTKRDDAKRLLVNGLDPATERKREKLVAEFKAANSFGDVAKEYIEKMVAEGRAEATTVKANWLLDQLKPIAAMPVADIKPIEVLAALKKLEARGKRETARRCRSFASRVFRYAVATGRGEEDPTSVLRGALAAPKVTHHAAMLDPKEVGELLRSIEAYAGNAITRIACQIAPHVMMRPGELRQALWSEIDMTAAVWTVPPANCTTTRGHSPRFLPTASWCKLLRIHMNYMLMLLSFSLLSCSAEDGPKDDVPTEMSSHVSNIEIYPNDLQEDTLSTLGLSRPKISLSWESLQALGSGKGYNVYRDRFDEEGVYGIYVGWNSDRSIFRSYKVTVEDGAVVKIEARYSYQDVELSRLVHQMRPACSRSRPALN
jgi:Phage integrase family.